MASAVRESIVVALLLEPLKVVECLAKQTSTKVFDWIGLAAFCALFFVLGLLLLLLLPPPPPPPPLLR